MPCFKGLAVSIHTPNGPLPEYSIQKQSRHNRIASYIPVPPPKFTAGSDKPEQSSFAVSVTLLTPGSSVPYSRPSPSPEEPHPTSKTVGGLPGFSASGERGKYTAGVGPYIPLTSSPNETVAAYIHFDGRNKEEVATLLRRGVETWVNSRWVGVAESEGGGLAEREFLFREVGLERWLNGLDLKGDGKEVAARIERRKKKLEKKRRKKLAYKDSDDEDEDVKPLARPMEKNGVLRYGDNKSSPVEDVSGDEGMMSSSDDSSEDEMPEPEATGQIKVSLFRVMASGEIKKGEYSPSFDAHDDEDDGMHGQSADDPGIDHTTSFAKPKTLDPKSISTQTVTGIDDPNKPYATFTFFYRGEKQLLKMGILKPSTSPDPNKASTAKRKSRQIEMAKLGPLQSDKGTTGFAGYRDDRQRNGTKRKDEDDMDSEGEEQEDAFGWRKKSPTIKKEPLDDERNVDGDVDEESKEILSQEEISRRAELAEGVEKMRLKRQHSFDPSQGRPASQAESQAAGPSTSASNTPPTGSPTKPAFLHSQASRLSEAESSASQNSPFKKPRASVSSPTQNEVASLNLNSSGTRPPADSPTPSAPLDISFSPPTSQPSFNSTLCGEAKVNQEQQTTGNAEDAGVVPPPPSPIPATEATVKSSEGESVAAAADRRMDQDEEL